MKARRKLFLAALLASVMSLGGPGLAAETEPEGEMRFALYVTVAPAWLDPGRSSRSRAHSSSQLTRSWREPDSNQRSLVCRGSVPVLIEMAPIHADVVQRSLATERGEVLAGLGQRRSAKRRA